MSAWSFCQFTIGAWLSLGQTEAGGVVAPASRTIIGVSTLWHRIFELPFLVKSSSVTNPAVFRVAGSPLQASSEAV
jgi:hypothetical protein